MSIPSLLVLGGGQMARALTGGMLHRGTLAAEQVTVVAPTASTRQWWTENHPGVAVSASAGDAIDSATAVLLAVKPHVIPTVLTAPELPASPWQGKLVISIAAGVSLQSLVRDVGHGRVVRVMPNTPSLVGEGASAYCVGEDVTEADVQTVQSMLASVGVAIAVTESQIDAVTGVSGSGPAYVFLMIEALADGGVAAGLPRPIALQLAAQTVLGAAKMVRETGQHPGQLKDNVCSPGGTTIAAVSVLEQNSFRSALIQAVTAAAEKSRSLGGR